MKNLIFLFILLVAFNVKGQTWQAELPYGSVGQEATKLFQLPSDEIQYISHNYRDIYFTTLTNTGSLLDTFTYRPFYAPDYTNKIFDVKKDSLGDIYLIGLDYCCGPVFGFYNDFIAKLRFDGQPIWKRNAYYGDSSAYTPRFVFPNLNGTSFVVAQKVSACYLISYGEFGADSVVGQINMPNNTTIIAVEQTNTGYFLFTKYNNELSFTLLDSDFKLLSQAEIIHPLLYVNHWPFSVQIFNNSVYVFGYAGSKLWIGKYELSGELINYKRFEDHSFSNLRPITVARDTSGFILGLRKQGSIEVLWRIDEQLNITCQKDISTLGYQHTILSLNDSSFIVAAGRSVLLEQCNPTISSIQAVPDVRLSIFPNPTTNNITIDWQNGSATISLFSALGQPTLKKKGEKRVILELSALDSGVYFVEIELERGGVVWRKVELLR